MCGIGGYILVIRNIHVQSCMYTEDTAHVLVYTYFSLGTMYMYDVGSVHII